MKQLMRRWVVTLMLSFVFAQLSSSQRTVAQTPNMTPEQPREYFDVPISIETPIQPIPVKGADGKWYLVYHLFLTNRSFSDLSLKTVEVSDKERSNTLVRYEDKELSDLDRFIALIPLPPRSQMPDKTYPRQIASGRTGALFFWLTVDTPTAIPAVLNHRFTFEANSSIKLLGDSSPKENGNMVLDDFKVGVSKDKPVVIGAPLRGAPWKCSNGPAYNTDHQYLATQGGKTRIAQRFAIDFQKIDAEGNILPNPFPNEITNKMFYGYGAEILAVADGVVASVNDGIPENIPQASGKIKPAVPITRETVAGNFISIDLGKNRYAFYAHLQPGSIRVKIGDKVRKGQVIGLLGNSGNAVGPHLHFHVGDADSLNGCEGIPFVFDSFEVIGQTRHVREMPLNNTVVRFP